MQFLYSALLCKEVGPQLLVSATVSEVLTEGSLQLS
jgi:hypothetical protein